MLKKYLFFAFLIVSQMVTGQKATITVESRDILTYPYSDPDPVPILAGRRAEIFPYHTFNGYSLNGQMQKWNVIKLENDYVEVYVMPTDGGKVWGAIEKSTGKEFVYRNEVMKYRNISMRGPWTSGGIEFNFGYIGHNPSTCVPVDYKTVENADGSVSCFVGSLDLSSRTKWYVEIRLPKDKAFFETRAMWNNPTTVPQSYYNWMTSSAVVTDDLEFFYPGNAEMGHGGEIGPWPYNEEVGKNLSLYRENNFGGSKSYHVVGEYNDFMGGYYHNSKFGFGHWALYDEVPGQKLWLWALARNGGIWEDLLTDTDGQYMEIQAGRTFNQYGGSSAFKTPISQVPFTPGLTDRWNEIWFPVKEIGGIVDASPMGVMNAKPENGKLEIGINALAFSQAKLVVKSGGKVLFTEDIKLKPMDVYKTSVSLSEGADYDVVVEGMDLQYNPQKRNILKRPFISKMPTDLITAASLYQEGMELKESRKYKQAGGILKKCLDMDPLFIDAMVALTELSCRSLQYDSALYFANNALQLDTYHPGANYFAGVTYHAQGNLIDAIESLGWAARSLEYRSTAYAQMAVIELKLGDNGLTEHYANLALDYNRNNFNALQTLTVLYRKTGETVLADKFIQTISTLDPLNHFADFERNLLHPSSENYSRFTSTITNEMPYQTYLELCLNYYDMGQKADALLVLEKAPAHPLVSLWKAYLRDDSSLLSEVTAASAAFVFPFRTESVSALNWALSKNNSWKFKYYLALNYAAIQRDTESMQMFEACGEEPDFAPFYLTRAALLRPVDDNKVLMDLQKATTLAPNDWRAANELIDYYISRHNNEMALVISTAAYKKFKVNPAIGIQHAIAQINKGLYAKSLKTLEGMNILPDEGARLGQVVFEQASLFLAMELMSKKKYSDAIKMIEKSKEWPETLGVGKPYVVDIRIQDYLKIFCVEKLNRPDEAVELRKSVIDYTNQYSPSSFNTLLALNILKEKGETDAVNALIKKMEEPGRGGRDRGPRGGSQVNQWVLAAFNNNQVEMNDLEKNFATNTNFMILKKLTEVTEK